MPDVGPNGESDIESKCSCFGRYLTLNNSHANITQPIIRDYSYLRALLRMESEDGDTTWCTLKKALSQLHINYDVATTDSEQARLLVKHRPQLLFVDVRSSSFNRNNIIGEAEINDHNIRIAVANKSIEKDTEKINSLLQSGFHRIIKETRSKAKWILLLIELVGGEVALYSALQQKQVLIEALDNSTDLIVVTNALQIIQYVNKCCVRVLGYRKEEIVGKPVQSFYQVVTSYTEHLFKQLEKGFEWEGRVTWRCNGGESLTVNCHASPYRQSPGGDITHLILTHDIPGDNYAHVLPSTAPRGSISSARKGSCDVKSINSDGGLSLRRLSLVKLSNLPLEAPITKIMCLICKAQENSSDNVVQMLDKVIDLLRSTELYSSTFKSDNIRYEDPVASDLIGALVTSCAVPTSTTRRSSNDSAAMRQVANKHKSLIPTNNNNNNISFGTTPHLKLILDESLSWHFQIFKLEEITGKRPLVFLGMNLLQQHRVDKTLGCELSVMHSWLDIVERHYRAENAYHNSTHAADVLQATSVFLSKENVKKHMDPLDEACALIAAIVHDINHPGKSSAFLCNSGDSLAILYNDISVLEHHHAALTFKLTLQNDRVNIFKGLERDTYKVVRQSIIDMILATDMTKHLEHYTKFVSIYGKCEEDGYRSLTRDSLPLESESGEGTRSAEDVKFLKRMLIKCADVSNPARPIEQCKEWARRIAEEYFIQTEEEKASNLPIVMPTFDRATCSISKSQMSFIDYITRDMLTTWHEFIQMPELLEHMNANYEYWKLRDEKMDTPKISNEPRPSFGNLPDIPELNSANSIEE